MSVRRPARLSAVAAALAALLATGCGKPEPLRIGYLGELSGRYAELGEAARDGLALAADDLRGRGILGDRPVEVLVRGTGDGPADAARAARELAAAGVEAIVGPGTAAMAEAVRPVTEQAGIVLLSPAPATSRACGRDDGVFCLRQADGEGGADAARQATGHGLRRLTIAIAGDSRHLTQDWLAAFRATFERAGGQVPASLFFASGGDPAELAALVRELLRPGPDGLLIVAPAAETARLARGVREVNPVLPLIATEWAASEALVAQGGRAVEGMRLVDGIDRQDASPRFREFRERHARQFKREPVAASVRGFDAGTAVLEAMVRRPTGMPLKEALIRLGPFAGLQQPVRFDAHGDARRKPCHVVIRDGRFVTE